MASPPVRRYFSAIGFDKIDGTIQAQLDPDAAASGSAAHTVKALHRELTGWPQAPGLSRRLADPNMGSVFSAQLSEIGNTGVLDPRCVLLHAGHVPLQRLQHEAPQPFHTLRRKVCGNGGGRIDDLSALGCNRIRKIGRRDDKSRRPVLELSGEDGRIAGL